MPLIMRSDLNELKFESTIKIDYVFAWGGIHFLQADQVVDLLGKLWNAKIKLLLLRERVAKPHAGNKGAGEIVDTTNRVYLRTW